MLALRCGPERTKKGDPHSSAPRVLDLRVVPRRVGGVPMSKGRYRTIEVKEVDWEAWAAQAAGATVVFAVDVAKEDLVSRLDIKDAAHLGRVKWRHPQQTGGLGVWWRWRGSKRSWNRAAPMVTRCAGSCGRSGHKRGKTTVLDQTKTKELPMNNLRPHTARRLRGTTSGTVPVRGSRRRSSTAASLCTRHCIRSLPHGYAAAPPARVTAFRRQMR